MYSRVIAKILPKYLPNRVNVVIKNVPGAGGRRGSAVLYRSKPDGYTIGMLNLIGLIVNDLVKPSTHFDIREYTYLVTCFREVAGIFVAADSEFNTIEDMQKADKVKFATGGRGSGTWLWGMLVKGIWNVPVHMVSGYSGSSEYLTALIRKDVDAFAIGFSTPLIPYFKTGEIKPFLIFSSEPWKLMPCATTLEGTSYEELSEFNVDRVVAAPPGLPEDIASILQESLLKALHDPDLQSWSKKTRSILYIKNAEDTRKNIKNSIKLVEKYKKYFIE